MQHTVPTNALRFLSIDAVQKANSGHPGMPMGMADVATVLFKDFLNFNPKNPNWINRDRFVLSAGHGSMLLYAISYLLGFDDCSLDDIKKIPTLNKKQILENFEKLQAINYKNLKKGSRRFAPIHFSGGGVPNLSAAFGGGG